MDEMRELKQIIIDDLKLEGLDPEDIQDDQPLFGEGLGLDSLDAVELVVILQKHYGIELKDMDKAREVFTNMNTLAEYVRVNRKKQ